MDFGLEGFVEGEVPDGEFYLGDRGEGGVWEERVGEAEGFLEFVRGEWGQDEGE